MLIIVKERNVSMPVLPCIHKLMIVEPALKGRLKNLRSFVVECCAGGTTPGCTVGLEQCCRSLGSNGCPKSILAYHYQQLHIIIVALLLTDFAV